MSNSSRFFDMVRSILSDDGTSFFRLESSAGTYDLTITGVPDVFVLDCSSVSEPALRMRHLRRRWRTSSILIANAQHERECALYIDEGADDACVADSPMLPSRLHAITRRARAVNADTRIVLGDLIVDREHRRMWCANIALSLSPREYDVLDCLFQRAPQVVDRDTLREHVWGSVGLPTPNAVEVYVCCLRRKVKHSSRIAINTVRGVGYALVVNAR